MAESGMTAHIKGWLYFTSQSGRCLHECLSIKKYLSYTLQSVDFIYFAWCVLSLNKDKQIDKRINENFPVCSYTKHILFTDSENLKTG